MKNKYIYRVIWLSSIILLLHISFIYCFADQQNDFLIKNCFIGSNTYFDTLTIEYTNNIDSLEFETKITYLENLDDYRNWINKIKSYIERNKKDSEKADSLLNLFFYSPDNFKYSYKHFISDSFKKLEEERPNLVLNTILTVLPIDSLINVPLNIDADTLVSYFKAEGNNAYSQVHIHYTASLPDSLQQKYQYIIFEYEDLRGCSLIGLNFKYATFYNCNMLGVHLDSAELSFSKFIESDLAGVTLTNANLYRVVYEAKSHPNAADMAYARNLDYITYDKSPASLVELKKIFRDAGFYEAERKVITALNRHSQEWWEKWLFDKTCSYGSKPFLPLKILLWLSGIFGIIYLMSLFQKSELFNA